MLWAGFNFSVAVAVGFIALAGVAVEVGVIMLVYLNQSVDKLQSQSKEVSDKDALKQAIISGAVQRLRPVLMTSLSIIIGLLPVMLGDGTGSQIMSRIAAPMVGGMVSALLLTLFILPVIFFLWKRHRLR